MEIKSETLAMIALYSNKVRASITVEPLKTSRVVNESNVQRTVREPFDGKFVYVINELT